MKVKDFDLEQTLECGQCFNFEKLSDKEYIVLAKGKMLHVKQTGDELEFLNASQRDIEKIWIPYFDLDRDYAAIKRAIAKAAPELKDIIKQYSGIRILDQDYVETLLSFIISQNKNIVHIKQIIRTISVEHGRKVGEVDIKSCDEDRCGTEIQKAIANGDKNRDYYCFPDMEALQGMTEDEFRRMKTGFRAAYLTDAIKRLSDGTLSEEKFSGLGYEECKQLLTQIKGVGDKVANCVLLFALGKRNAFPVDVWINRVMTDMYGEEIRKHFGLKPESKIKKEVIEKFAEEKFGEFGGYAQQYLFMYIREV